ncbi:MAG: Hsp20 family protein [Terracidiphilus sp.]
MANVPVRKVEDNRSALAPMLEGIKATYDKIRKRAFELFERRGGTPGFDVEDWIQAEHDLFWVPQAELTETDDEFTIKVGVPGFEAKDLDITAQPDEILIQGNAEKREETTKEGVCYSEFGTKSLYRRFQFAPPIEIGAVTANVENGMLTVTAPKKKEEEKNKGGKKVAVAA